MDKFQGEGNIVCKFKCYDILQFGEFSLKTVAHLHAKSTTQIVRPKDSARATVALIPAMYSSNDPCHKYGRDKMDLDVNTLMTS